MTDLTNLTDHAAQQNYQWMFVALFIVTLIFVIVIPRWATVLNRNDFNGLSIL